MDHILQGPNVRCSTVTPEHSASEHRTARLSNSQFSHWSCFHSGGEQ